MQEMTLHTNAACVKLYAFPASASKEAKQSSGLWSRQANINIYDVAYKEIFPKLLNVQTPMVP